MTAVSTRPSAHPTTTRSDGPGPGAVEPGSMSFGRRLLWLGPTGLVVAAVLSVAEWLIVTGPGNDGSVAAALLALTMTLPVVLARRFPIAAATAVGVAAVTNGLVFDDIVRCAGAFPAAVYIAFAVGAHSRDGGRGWAWTGLGFVITVGGLVAQWLWDPALNVSTEFLPFGLGLATASCVAGIGWSILVQRVRTSRHARRIG